MALSQIQCLDNNHVNPRTHESKPEFLYSEDQRLALEALLKDGREAFVKYVEARGLRGFLSDLEQDALTGTAEPYDPGLDIFPEGAEEDEPPLSLHYWPELSDMSIPQMDLGWPDSDAYRGVTRTTVYTQPPLDGQAHVKEIVRKMIAQAQKVIAVVMDVFTDVDIFRDLLDAGFKRRVSVYILLERTALPHFLSMCQRAQMHAGHLKHLRVRCTDGTEFYTRSCTKVRGRMGHRFMFIDGDKAVSGSYSFTWTSSRLDRNLITVVTGHAVDTFDRLFRCLYMNSSFVDLRQVATVPAPEPEPIPQPAAVAPLPAALARKMHNPKYALVFVENPSPTPTTDPCADQESPKEAQNLTNSQKGKKRRAIKEALEENVPLHPGLSNLEKACLISYLPTWPEPDPPSDVIGFINVRDSSKPTKVHLQRSERFETSQAIRFSSPFSMPKEVLPEVAKPRQRTTEPVGVSKPRATQDKAKEVECVVDKLQPTHFNTQSGGIKMNAEEPKQRSATTEPKSKPFRESSKAEHNLHSNTSKNQDTGHTTARTLSQTSIKAAPPDNETQTVTTNNPKPDSLPEINTDKEAQTKNNPSTPSAAEQRAPTLSSDCKQTSYLLHPTDSNSEEHTQTLLPHADSHAQITQTQTPVIHSYMHSPPVSSTSFSANNHIYISTEPSGVTTNACDCSSATSSSLISTPPILKPRTVFLVIKDVRNHQSTSTVTRPDSLAREQVDHSEPSIATEAETPADNNPVAGRRPGVQKDDGNMENLGKTRQQKQREPSPEEAVEEAVGPPDIAGTQMVSGIKLQTQSDGLITFADNVKEPETLMLADCYIAPKPPAECVATAQTETKTAPRPQTDRELAKVPKEKRDNRAYLAEVGEPQRKSYCGLDPKDVGVLDIVGLKAPPHNQHLHNNSTDHALEDELSQQGNAGVTSACHGDDRTNASRNKTVGTSEERTSCHIPKKPLRLYLSNPYVQNVRSPERESQSALIGTTTPDGLLPCLPSPDSETHAPDSSRDTPDFRTLSPDVSDGYFSPMEALSTTSEEYYECSDSPCQDPVIDRSAYRSHGTTEDHINNTHIPNTPNSTSPAYKGKDSTKIIGKEQDYQPPKRKRMLNKSAAERLVDGGPNPGESTSVGTESRQLSTGEHKPDKDSSGVERPKKVSSGGQMAPGCSSEETKDRTQSARKTERQKQDSRAFSPPRPTQPSRPTQSILLMGPRPWGSQPLNQAESKVLQSSSQGYTSSTQKMVSRTSPLQAAGHKQPDVSQKSPLAQGRARAGQDQRSYLKHSNMQQLFPHSQSHTVSTQETHRHLDGKLPFSVTFSRLYSLKGLKDKMSKLPAHSKRSSTSSPVQGHKKTS
ncbi:uncharacterized protein fam83ga isoform 2-T2 [Aulostomus maculatus]